MATLNYNHLRYFWAVAHSGNLTRTAEQLNVSQSALSLQIKKLEERLGHQLFERRGKQLLITEAGRIALDHADVIFRSGEDLLAALGPQGESAGRTLRVGALSTLSRNFQTEFLRPITHDQSVHVVVRSGSLGELLGLLQSRQVDVVLTNRAPQRDATTPWQIHTLSEQTVSLIGGAPADEGDLAAILSAHRLILPPIESGIRIGFDALAERLGVTPSIFAEVDDMALMRVLAREKVALAVIPPIVVRDELASGRLTEIAGLPGLVERFYAVTVVRRFPNPLLGQLVKPIDGTREAAKPSP